MAKNLPANAGDAGNTSAVPGSGNPLEEEMSTHSSTVAWKSQQTEELSRLQSMGSQRVRHN